MKQFLWRTWFFLGLGGTLASIVILPLLGSKVSPVLIVYFVFSYMGFGYGLSRVVFHRDNPFDFLGAIE